MITSSPFIIWFALTMTLIPSSLAFTASPAPQRILEYRSTVVPVPLAFQLSPLQQPRVSNVRWNVLVLSVVGEESSFVASALEEVPQASTTTSSGVDSSTTSAVASPASPRKMVARNLARGGEIQEFNFVDPYMAANTNPFELNWWAYPLFGFPFVLLANDAFHFIPTEGPLSFFTRF